jgi:outer membrane receptor protein involved in Fe transport
MKSFCARVLCAALGCVLLAYGASIRAASGATLIDVTGTIVASDGTALAGAHVTLVSRGNSQSVTSDARGHFVLSGLPAGTYAVYADAPGYNPLSQRTVTLQNSDATLALSLSRASTNTLTVIGDVRTSAGGTVSTSSAPSVALNAQAAAAEGTTAVSDMVWSQLATTPVLPLGGGSNATASFALRGPDPTETLVSIDGHQVNNGNTGDFDLSLIDPAALQDVQIVYGISPSSLVGPNTLGGAINILTLEPTTTPHALLRAFGGSFNSFGATLQATGTDSRLGYALSLHSASSSGSVNQDVPVLSPSGAQTSQFVGSGSRGDNAIAKLRYQLGGQNGYGYIQLDVRDQSVVKDDSALLTNYTPGPGGGYESFAGTLLQTYQSGYGLDAQLPLGHEVIDGAPATVLQFSHLTTLASQSVAGPGADTTPYLYNQRDLLGDDWIELDHNFSSGQISFKYDLGTETLTTDYVQGQVIAQGVLRATAMQETPSTEVFPLSQVERSAVLRYNGDPTTHIHYSLAGYFSNYSTFGTSFNPRAGFTWTPTGNTAVRASVGSTFQTPQLSELVVPPPEAQVPIGGVIYVGNPNLKPDYATEYDLGAQQIFGRPGHQLSMSMDIYQTNLRAASNQLVVTPIPNCDTPGYPACPLSYPINAGNGPYRGIEIRAEQQLGSDFRLRAGWDEDSSYLTFIPASIQDGTLVPYEQSLGQPLHKAYLNFERSPARGFGFGATLHYEGTYNELNQPPYATLDAHVVYRSNGYEFGLYGTNLTNVYASPFTIINGGVPYGAMPGQPMIPTPAYMLQGAKVVFVVTRSM